MIFVFGSNEAGIHGAGAAKTAYKTKGATWGQGFGRSGNSFGIPTKDGDMKSLKLFQVRENVDDFLLYADANPEIKFQVTQIGCGLAGFKPEQIAPMFKDAPSNCFFDKAWEQYLPGKQFWGTF